MLSTGMAGSVGLKFLLILALPALAGPLIFGRFAVLLASTQLATQVAALGVAQALPVLVGRGDILASGVWQAVRRLAAAQMAVGGGAVLVACIAVEASALECASILAATTASTAVLDLSAGLRSLEAYQEERDSVLLIEAAASLLTLASALLDASAASLMLVYGGTRMAATVAARRFFVRSAPTTCRKYQPKSSQAATRLALGSDRLLLIRTGLSGQLGVIAALMMYRIDVVMLGRYAAPAAIGAYFVVLSFFDGSLILNSALRAAELNRLTRQLRSVDVSFNSYRRQVLPRFTALTVLPTILALGALQIYARIVPAALLLPRSSTVILIFMGSMSLGMGRVGAVYLAAQRELRRNATAAWIAVSVNILLNLVLIPAYGVLGAAISSATAYTLLAVTQWRTASQYSQTSR